MEIESVSFFPQSSTVALFTVHHNRKNEAHLIHNKVQKLIVSYTAPQEFPRAKSFWLAGIKSVLEWYLFILTQQAM